jgi:hypothetical protein
MRLSSALRERFNRIRGWDFGYSNSLGFTPEQCRLKPFGFTPWRSVDSTSGASLKTSIRCFTESPELKITRTFC